MIFSMRIIPPKPLFASLFLNAALLTLTIPRRYPTGSILQHLVVQQSSACALSWNSSLLIIKFAFYDVSIANSSKTYQTAYNLRFYIYVWQPQVSLGAFVTSMLFPQLLFALYFGLCIMWHSIPLDT